MATTIKNMSIIAVTMISAIVLTVCVYSFFSSFVFISVKAQKIQNPKVEITYPEAYQHIPSGRLKIYGISSDRNSTLCQVFVLINDQRPYQNATATGLGGEDDYSKWTFTFDPYYSLVRDGANQIVSKINCRYNDDTNSAAYNKIYVTGVGAGTSPPLTMPISPIQDKQQGRPNEESYIDDSNIPLGPFFFHRQ
jgi:hypothetical protein